MLSLPEPRGQRLVWGQTESGWAPIGWTEDVQIRWATEMPAPLVELWPPPSTAYTVIELDVPDDQDFYRLVEMMAGPQALADFKQSERAQAVWESEGGSYL